MTRTINITDIFKLTFATENRNNVISGQISPEIGGACYYTLGQSTTIAHKHPLFSVHLELFNCVDLAK